LKADHESNAASIKYVKSVAAVAKITQQKAASNQKELETKQKELEKKQKDIRADVEYLRTVQDDIKVQSI